MTVGNYVRNLSGLGAAAAHRHRSRAPTSPCQFRMQFPSGIALVRIGLRRCVTCVFELHAKFVWTRPCRRPPHRWGLVCCCVGEPRLCLAFGTKFSLLGFLVVRTVQNSPCMSKKRQIEPFRVSWESFVPEVGPCGSCWESFVPHMRWEGACWESFVPEVGPCGSCWESFVPHMRCEGCAGRVLYRSGAAWFLLGEICFVVAPSVCAVVGLPPPTGAPSWPRPLQRARHWWRWGFCSIRSWLSACRRRVAPLMLQFSPIGGGAAAVRGGAVAKVQTLWVKTVK